MLFRRGNLLQQLSIMKCANIFPGNLQLEVIIKLLVLILMTNIISTIPIIIISITTIVTRSYATLQAPGLDWIVWPEYSLGGYILGVFNVSLCASGTQLGLDLTCFVIVICHGKKWRMTKRDTQTPHQHSWFQVSFHGSFMVSSWFFTVFHD